MRAAVRTRCGPPDMVGIAQVAEPAPADAEVLVRVLGSEYAGDAGAVGASGEGGHPAGGLGRPSC